MKKKIRDTSDHRPSQPPANKKKSLKKLTAQKNHVLIINFNL